MNSKFKIIIYFLIIAVWLGIIYSFSSMDYFDTNELSNNVIYNAINMIVPNSYNITDIVNMLNAPIRKLAHMFEFCILGIIINSFFYCIKKNLNIKHLVICILL